MQLTADFHTHTPYSHGKNKIWQNAEKAKQLGLQKVGVTDHGFSHAFYGLERQEIRRYRAECEEASKRFGIEVLVGIESNITGANGKGELTEKDFENFDLYLAGAHLFVHFDTFKDEWRYLWTGNLLQKIGVKPSKSLVDANTKAYINLIKNNPIDVLTHVGYVCPCDPVEVAKCASDYGTYIELNGKKAHLTDEQLNDVFQKTKARFVVDSDAHSAERVGEVDKVRAQIERVGVDVTRIDNVDGRLPTFRFAEWKKRM